MNEEYQGGLTVYQRVVFALLIVGSCVARWLQERKEVVVGKEEDLGKSSRGGYLYRWGDSEPPRIERAGGRGNARNALG